MGQDRRWDALNDALAGGARPQSVEVKALVEPRHRRRTMDALGVRARSLRHLRVSFVDTARLDLARHGLVVRLREFDSGRADLTVKVRRSGGFAEPAPQGGSLAEIDALPGSVAWTLAHKRRVPVDKVRAVRDDVGRLSRLLTRGQWRLAELAMQAVDLDALHLLGPIDVVRAPTERIGGVRSSWELWQVDSGPRIVEISTRCAARDASRVAAKTLSALDRRGVSLAPRQRLKTRLALEHLVRDLRST